MTPIEITAVEETVKQAGSLINRIFGPIADTYSLIRQDNLNVRRLKNQIKNLTKIKKIIDDEGLTMKNVNLKAIVPLLDGISLEEDEALQKKWINLFVNYVDAKKKLMTHIFPDLLSQISSSEAELIEFIESNYNRTIIANDAFYKDDVLMWSVDGRDIPQHEIDNLIRLGLARSGGSTLLSPTASIISDCQLTELGHSFILACKR